MAIKMTKTTTSKKQNKHEEFLAALELLPWPALHAVQDNDLEQFVQMFQAIIQADQQNFLHECYHYTQYQQKVTRTWLIGSHDSNYTTTNKNTIQKKSE